MRHASVRDCSEKPAAPRINIRKTEINWGEDLQWKARPRLLPAGERPKRYADVQMCE
jgi:hypothetical protein